MGHVTPAILTQKRNGCAEDSCCCQQVKKSSKMTEATGRLLARFNGRCPAEISSTCQDWANEKLDSSTSTMRNMDLESNTHVAYE